MALTTTLAGDIAVGLLQHYIKGPALLQTEQDRPLLRFLAAGKKEFPGGNATIRDRVRGAVMNDTAGFFAGYTDDDVLSFAQAGNMQQIEYTWYECHAGLVITWTELKKDGITISDNNKKSEHAGISVDRLTSLLADRLDDFGESWSRAKNNMLWRDGTQDSLQVPGVLALINPATPATGTIGGLNAATYTWWQTNAWLGILPSPENQTLARTLRSKQRVLRKRMGKPNKFLAGSEFIDALELEVQQKGEYTTTGFANGGKNDIGMADISLRGVGTFEYDPTLDDLGMAKYCFEFDSRRLTWRPMAGEENKLLNPERPYDQAVFLQSMTTTGALTMNQRNCHGVFSVA